jgi:hypothetical protein
VLWRRPTDPLLLDRVCAHLGRVHTLWKALSDHTLRYVTVASAAPIYATYLRARTGPRRLFSPLRRPRCSAGGFTRRPSWSRSGRLPLSDPCVRCRPHRNHRAGHQAGSGRAFRQRGRRNWFSDSPPIGSCGSASNKELSMKRIHGPTKHGRKWRLMIVAEDDSKTYRSFETEAQAEAEAIRLRARCVAGPSTRLSVKSAIERYEVEARKRNKPKTEDTTITRLRSILKASDLPISGVTTKGLQEGVRCPTLGLRHQADRAAGTSDLHEMADEGRCRSEGSNRRRRGHRSAQTG